MNKKNKVNKLWGGAFNQDPFESAVQFSSGHDVSAIEPADYKLLPYDTLGSKAHCLMLYKQKIISQKDCQIILKGLIKIEKLVKQKKFILDSNQEDVHTNIETWLINKYGIESPGKLHTARSRNDQVCLDTRLYLKDQIINFIYQTISLSTFLVKESSKYLGYVLPGFTHHQHAMVTTFRHVLLAYSSMLLKDTKRFMNWFNLHNTNPLGSAVSYGTSFNIDQFYTSSLLGFDNPDLDSLDSITNRGEAELDLAFGVIVLMNHLSSLAQTLILFSTPEFGMVQLADGYSSGSSMMPQKKNPQVLEVIKGKTGLVAGYLQGLINIGKANFIGYNADSQWTKYLILGIVDECLLAPKTLGAVIKTMKVNKTKMAYWCQVGFIGTTTLLEQLCSTNNLPFRLGKIVVEKAVKYSLDKNKVTYQSLLQALKEEKIKVKVSKKQVEDWQDPYKAIELSKSFGGPGLINMKLSKNIILKELKKCEQLLKEKIEQKEKALNFMQIEINKI